ncbi:hypothetical protein PRK78_002621 [Emydomyces testavorans]|uniref:Uncharacterized protein n=1 Tax=Emydomyces testavorans TaxID=2070801 RepID=A0AAF0DEN4_9EURO|nr:hypothetical protein PRK78_002621 [Emydomyces testavorans]
MASGAFFDPLRLLRVAPLLSSTGTLIYATTELIYNSSFLHPSVRKHYDELLPKWWTVVFRRGVWVVLALVMTTSTTAMANLVFDHCYSLPSFSTKLYWSGLVGAMGHLIFVPWVAGPVQQMMEEQSKDGFSSNMAKFEAIEAYPV